MALYKIGLTRSAEAELRKIHKGHIPAVLRKIKLLERDPRPSGLVLLRGQDRHYRIRQGDYRIIYEVDDVRRAIVVIKIGHRREVYSDR